MENINPNVQEFQKLAMVKQWKTMILSKCAIFDSKKSRFIKKQEAKEILNKTIKEDSIFSWYFALNAVPLNHYEMNEIANKFLLAGDKCVPGIHLKQSGFAYSGFGQFTKNKERIQKIKTAKQNKQEIQYIFTKMN